MPAKKQKKAQQVEEPQETEEVEDEQENQLYDRMEARLTKTFQSQFAEFHKAIEKIAKAADKKKTPPKKKQHEPAPRTTYDTRNKALRAQYNPGMEVGSDSFNDQQGNISYGTVNVEADAIDPRDPDDNNQQPLRAQAQQHIQHVNIRPPCTDTGVMQSGPITKDKNTDMNQWIIGRAFPTKPAAPGSQLPMSAREFGEQTDLDRKVQTIIANSATNISRGKDRQGLFPYKYVFRGEELKMATMNSLSVADHCWAIFRMVRDDAVSPHIKPHLVTHIEQVLEDARMYNWVSAVRPWSNEVFSRVAEGRLSEGWASYNEIQLLRIAISQASIAKLTPSQQDGQQGFRSTQPSFSNDQLRGGPPCVNFNSQKGCSLPSGHIVNGQKLTHICAYCLFNAAVARPHSEFYCRNKQRQPTTTHF